MEFVIANGLIVKKEEFVPFFYDGSPVLIRKLWFGHGGIPLLFKNLEILRSETEITGNTFPEWMNDKNETFRIIKRMLNKNRFFRSGLITIKLFTASRQFLIESHPYEEFTFPLSKQGIILGASDLPVFSCLPLNQHSFYQYPLWKVAEAEIIGSPVSNVIFQNEKGFLTHCISANFYAMSSNVLFTPSLKTGCWRDILHEFIVKSAESIKLTISESENLTWHDLKQMGEIFIASEEKGIQWVMGIENKRFVNNYSVKIAEKINELLKAVVQ